MTEADRQIAIRFVIIFDDYFEGIRSWEECERELAQDARYYEHIFGSTEADG